MRRIFFIVLFPLLFLSCHSGECDLRLERALSLAGDNRVELEKVLNRYSSPPSDSLKYRAARFLIENMSGVGYLDGASLDRYAIYFDALGRSKLLPRAILDSLAAVLGPFDAGSLVRRHDLREVDSTLLCENIDFAFLVWKKYPWNACISFEDFCEEILPYRIRDERLSNWRREFYERFSPLVDGLETDDPVVAARHLREVILRVKGKPRFTMDRPAGYPNLDARHSLSFNGSCDDLSQFTLFVFRSVGIPCTVDFIPICGDYNVGHSWVSFRDHDGSRYAMDFFDEIEYVSDKSHSRGLRKFKAYRKTFSMDESSVASMQEIQKEVPGFFSPSRFRFRDVTSLYSNNFMEDVRIPSEILYRRPRGNEIVYLCGPSWMKWIPLAWCIPDGRRGVSFRDLNVGDIARLATFGKSGLSFLSDPFRINEQTRSCETFSFASDSQRESATLFSKYTLDPDLPFRERMVGGVFEGSNDPAFRNSDTLYLISELPFRLITRVRIPAGKRYRFVRYKGPVGSYCNVAEVRFYSGDVELHGRVIGTPGCSQGDGSHEYGNVFDGLTETSFDHDTPDDGWAGLDFGAARMVTSIDYSPRNRDNYVEEGHQYELFVCGRNGWESLGMMVAEADSLRYDDIPPGGLYYLKDRASGIAERPFRLVRGKQIFN